MYVQHALVAVRPGWLGLDIGSSIARRGLTPAESLRGTSVGEEVREWVFGIWGGSQGVRVGWNGGKSNRGGVECFRGGKSESRQGGAFFA